MADWSAHIRAYSTAQRGAPIPVTANIFDGTARGLHYLQHVDVWCGEKADLNLRGDNWYRFAHGVACGTPTSFSNAPNAYVAQISDDMRDGKPQYLRHMPRVWNYLQRSLAHPTLGSLNAWYRAHVPALNTL
jgi:hypothetical protein